ncbi:MAG: hypothetical protein P1P89_16315 [Desulfobacterales bacterium]|nr:hypothetical protein [Desulfobacterales bacterium]
MVERTELVDEKKEHTYRSWTELQDELRLRELIALARQSAELRNFRMEKNMSKEEIEDYVGDILVQMPNHRWLEFTFDNFEELHKKGVYERFLLRALTGCRGNNHRWSAWDIELMLDIADRNKLMEAGDPLPGSGPFTVYRGVAGKGPARRLRGISWTSDFDKAVWFARRFERFLNKPMVYETVVQREQVLAYNNSRNESEFLCLIPKDQKLRRVWSNKAEKESEIKQAA